MTYISKETRDRIEADAKAHVEKTRGREGRVETYKTAAISEAGRSQDLVYALEMVLSVTSWMEDNAYKHEIRKIAKEAIAKYKEVSNG